MPNLSSFFSNTQFVTMTAGEAISVGDIVSVSSTDGRVYWANDPTDTSVNVNGQFRPFNYSHYTRHNPTRINHIPFLDMMMQSAGNTTFRSLNDVPFSTTITPDKNIALVFITSNTSTGTNSTLVPVSAGNAALLTILDPYGNTVVRSKRIFANGIFNGNTNISICANNSALFVTASSIDTTSNTIYFAAYTNSGSVIYSNTVSNTNHSGWSYCQPTEDGGFLAATVGTVGLTSTGRMIVANGSGGVAIANTISASANVTSNSAITNYKLLRLANTRNFALVQGPYSANATTYYSPTVINITANTTFLRTTNTTIFALPTANTDQWSRMDVIAGAANDIYMVIGVSGANLSTVPTANLTCSIYHANLSANTYYYANTTGRYPNSTAAVAAVPPIGSSVKLIKTVTNTYAVAYTVSSKANSGITFVEMFYDNGSTLSSNGVNAISSLEGNNAYLMFQGYAEGTTSDLAYDSYNNLLKIGTIFNTGNVAFTAAFPNNAIVYTVHDGTSGVQISTDNLSLGPRNVRGILVPKFLTASSIDTSNSTLYNPLSNVVQGLVGLTVLAIGSTTAPFSASYASGYTGLYSYSNSFSLTPIGVSANSATAAGNTITVQILGTTNTRLTFKTPYSIDSTSRGGQRMSLVGNTAIMAGTLPTTQQVESSPSSISTPVFRRSIS